MKLVKLVRLMIVAVVACGVGFAADRATPEQTANFYNGAIGAGYHLTPRLDFW